MPDEPERPTGGLTGRFGRRLFLVSMAVFSVLLSFPSGLKAFFLRSFPVRTVEEDAFRFEPETGMVYWKEQKTSEPFTLLLDGMVEKPVGLSYEDLRSLPQVNRRLIFTVWKDGRSGMWSGEAYVLPRS